MTMSLNAERWEFFQDLMFEDHSIFSSLFYSFSFYPILISLFSTGTGRCTILATLDALRL
jgi:hypothetical protein